MDTEELKFIADQLKRPNGDFAIKVGELMNAGNENINLKTIETLNLSPNDRVLEIGMGNGFFVKNILSVDETIKYSGCDYSKIMVLESQKENCEYISSNRANFHHVNAEHLPFKKKSFNKIFTIHTIYFWEDSKQILNEFYRVLKPKGKLILSVTLKETMELYSFSKYGFKIYTKKEIVNLLEANSFKVIDTIEETYPNQDVMGQKIDLKTLIISAEKF